MSALVLWVRPCSFPLCGRQAKSYGWCQSHYMQNWHGRPLHPLKPYGREVCSFGGCDGKHKALGLCGGHLEQRKRGQALRPLQRMIKYPTQSERSRRAHLRRTFNMTPEQYDDMVQAQGGVCAACGQPERKIHPRTGEVQPLSIDHDHACCPGATSCGKCVRSLLCDTCNRALGMFGDDMVRLLALVRYLAKHHRPVLEVVA